MRDAASGRVCARPRTLRWGSSSLWLLLGLIVPRAEPLATRCLPLWKPLHAAPHAAASSHRLVLRRGAARWGRGLVACAEEEEAEEDDPDADLASAWLDENDAGVLQGESVYVEAADAFEHARSGEATLIDLRTPEQFANGHAPGGCHAMRPCACAAAPPHTPPCRATLHALHARLGSSRRTPLRPTFPRSPTACRVWLPGPDITPFLVAPGAASATTTCALHSPPRMVM
jgi:hypothetical protein